MPGGETEYFTAAPFGYGLEEALAFIKVFFRGIVEEGREIVGEGKDPIILWVFHAAGPFIARTEIAGFVILWQLIQVRFFYLSLPGPLGSMG